MPSSPTTRRQDATIRPFSPTLSMNDPNDTFLNFHDSPLALSADGEQMLFGDLDIEDKSSLQPTNESSSPSSSVPFPWHSDVDFTGPPPLTTNYQFGPSLPSPTETYYDPASFYSAEELQQTSPFEYASNWLDLPSPASPIPVPANSADSHQSQSFVPFAEPIHFPATGGAFSPTEFAALHPLPSSFSPSSSLDEPQAFQRQRVDSISQRVDSISISPQDTTVPTPDWASRLFNSPSPPRASPSPHRRSPPGDRTQRPRLASRRDTPSASDIFQSSSAPSFSPLMARNPTMTRSYSRRAESVSYDDGEATVRRKRKISAPEDLESSSKTSENVPLKPVVRPPKLAPSAWQLYFTDWIQRHQASNTRKLNVAQAAKEAGQEYACLSDEEKEPYKRRSQILKQEREAALGAYMRTLTPDDIRRENAYRTAQRKAGKSRKSNIKDPNAPKKPLSAYFMFLQRIRASPEMVQEVFGDETETTRQSVLAAAKWRSMTDDERKPYLAQAEQEKMEYEAARRLYEEGTTGSGFGNSINFSILTGSPAFPSVKMESESESEGLAGDDTFKRYIRS